MDYLLEAIALLADFQQYHEAGWVCRACHLAGQEHRHGWLQLLAGKQPLPLLEPEESR